MRGRPVAKTEAQLAYEIRTVMADKAFIEWQRDSGVYAKAVERSIPRGLLQMYDWYQEWWHEGGIGHLNGSGIKDWGCVPCLYRLKDLSNTALRKHQVGERHRANLREERREAITNIQIRKVIEQVLDERLAPLMSGMKPSSPSRSKWDGREFTSRVIGKASSSYPGASTRSKTTASDHGSPRKAKNMLQTLSTNGDKGP